MYLGFFWSSAILFNNWHLGESKHLKLMALIVAFLPFSTWMHVPIICVVEKPHRDL